jgi:hypothetical protein
MVAAAAGVPAVAAMALEAALAVALQVRAARASASRVPAALLDQHLGRGLVPSCRGLRRRAAWAHGNDPRAPGDDSQPGPPPTTPLPPPSVSPEDTRALSRAQWGRARAEVDAELRERYRTGTTTAPSSRPPWPHSGYGCCARPAKANRTPRRGDFRRWRACPLSCSAHGAPGVGAAHQPGQKLGRRP